MTPVRAQQLNVSVSPPQVEILVKPGISVLQAIELKNQGDPVVFSTRIVSFEPQGDNGGRIFKDKAEGPLRFSLENSEVKLGEKFLLDSRKSFQALLKIRTIPNAPEGDYYYTFFFLSEPPTSQQTASRARAAIGVNLLVSVTSTGILKGEGKIAQFQVIPHYSFSFMGKDFALIDSGKKVAVILKVANIGTNVITPDAFIRLKGPFNLNKKKQLLSFNILKRSTRYLYQEDASCNYCKGPFSTVFDGFFFGNYLLSTEIEFEGANKKIFASTEFWAFPVTFTIWLTVAVFLFTFLWLYIAQHRKGKML